MGKRLTGFDYSRPYFYMVTMMCCKVVAALSEIVAPGRCQMNAITRAFVNCIRHFHEGCKAIAPIECFSIMPDHIHLLIRLLNDPKSATLRAGEIFIPLRLEAVVEMIMQALEGRYREVTGKRKQVFEAAWHDWIVSRDGQLMAFTRYIRENPGRSWLRQSHREYFQRVSEVEFLDRKWYGYGNAALLQLPVLEPMRYSRKLVEGGRRRVERGGCPCRANRAGWGRRWHVHEPVREGVWPRAWACGRSVGCFVARGVWRAVASRAAIRALLRRGPHTLSLALAGDGARANQARALRPLPPDGRYRRRGVEARRSTTHRGRSTTLMRRQLRRSIGRMGQCRRTFLKRGAHRRGMEGLTIPNLFETHTSFPVNDLDLKTFNSQILPIYDKLKTLCMQNRSLASARDILLPQLMSGKKEEPI